MDTQNVELLLAAAAPLIDLAMAEDIGPGDATSLGTLDACTHPQGFVTTNRWT